MSRAAIWGAGNTGKNVLLSLPREVTVTAFVDSNPAKAGKRFCGIPVVGPGEVRSIPFDVIYIANTHGEPLRSYLSQECGVEESRIVDVLDRGNLDQRRGVLNALRDEIYRRNLPGSVAEVGVYRGEFAQYVNLAFPDKKLLLFDTFSGFEEADVEHDKTHGYSATEKKLFADTSIEVVKRKLPHPEKAEFRVGVFPESAEGTSQERYCFVSIDVDLYRPTRLAIGHFYRKLVPGGYIMVHDYGTEEFEGVRVALLELADELGLVYFPVTDSGGSVVIGK